MVRLPLEASLLTHALQMASLESFVVRGRLGPPFNCGSAKLENPE